MKKLKYEEFTIENAENMIKTGCITEIICDGDNKTISISEEEYLELEKVFEKLKESLQPVIEAICEVGKKICETFSNAFTDLKNTLNKKLTKKKFIKLLQSAGIQRNEINKIIKNNKEEYTYLRYYKILNKFSKDERN